MYETIISDKASFEFDVPYKLISNGDHSRKPMIVYFHGYDQNIEYLEKKVEPMLNIEAYHLFIQGPYPVYDKTRSKRVSRWGRAWYLYDGDQSQFVRSMEEASSFIESVINEVKNRIDLNRICLWGYSMGGYLAGYYALSRFEQTDDLIVIGGRIKTEVFEEQLHLANNIRVLALHGKNDTSVYPEPQKKCIDILKQYDFDADFKLLNCAHSLGNEYIDASTDWLQKKGFKLTDR